MAYTRRRFFAASLAVVAVALIASGMLAAPKLSAQGRCMLTPGTPACNTADIAPPFAPTGWKTIALDHITFQIADYKKETAFYVALMGWKLRSDDGTQAVLDIGDWGTAVFKQMTPVAADPAAPAGRGGASRAAVESYGFVIDHWNAKTVEAELLKRGLTPVADNDGKSFESFHVKDPDGFDVQISNGNGFSKARKSAATPSEAGAPAPFEPTGWKTIWLDHISFNSANYKLSASFYQNLLGWTPTYDEGSQNELMAGDVGDVIFRGGNPLDPNAGRGGGRTGGAAAPARARRIDHISFGITPWDTDGVKAELEKRGLSVQIDTSSKHLGPDGTYVPDDIHTAAFKSYHTQTPNGFNLQISYVTHENRLALANAVKPKGRS